MISPIALTEISLSLRPHTPTIKLRWGRAAAIGNLPAILLADVSLDHRIIAVNFCKALLAEGSLARLGVWVPFGVGKKI